MDKMRFLILLFKGLGLKENLRKLLLSQVCLDAYRHGDTVRIVRGTRTKEISAEQLADEVSVYSEAGIDDAVAAKLRAVRRSHKVEGSEGK